MSSAITTQIIISATPFWSLQPQTNINSDFGGLLRATEKMQTGFLLLPTAEEAEQFTIEKCSTGFPFKSYPEIDVK